MRCSVTWCVISDLFAGFTCWAARFSWCKTKLYGGGLSLRCHWWSDTFPRQIPTLSSLRQPRLGSKSQIAGWGWCWLMLSLLPYNRTVSFSSFLGCWVRVRVRCCWFDIFLSTSIFADILKIFSIWSTFVYILQPLQTKGLHLPDVNKWPFCQ